MLNSKTQILMGFAVGHQTPQRPARKSRTVTTKLFFYINVEGTTMTLCFIQTHVLLQDHSDRKFCYCLTWEQKTWKLKGHSVLFKCKRIGILVSQKLNCTAKSKHVKASRSDHMCTIVMLLWPFCLDLSPSIYQNQNSSCVCV